jgi:hypothetical protein
VAATGYDDGYEVLAVRYSFAEQLAYPGWSGRELHKMLAVNPRAFLGSAVPTSAPEES